jgi:regulator of replication initiation timing
MKFSLHCGLQLKNSILARIYEDLFVHGILSHNCLTFRAQLGETDEDKKTVEQEQTVSQKQMEESYTLLRKLHEDGFEMVTNIRVATDAREVARRVEEEEGLRQR